jgi:hypothetical protein
MSNYALQVTGSLLPQCQASAQIPGLLSAIVQHQAVGEHLRQSLHWLFMLPDIIGQV